MYCSLLVGAHLGGGHCFFEGQEIKHLSEVHQFLVTAVREASLLSFLYFTFYVSCLVIIVRQMGSAELRTNSPWYKFSLSFSTWKGGRGWGQEFTAHSCLVGINKASQGNNTAISLPGHEAGRERTWKCFRRQDSRVIPDSKGSCF